MSLKIQCHCIYPDKSVSSWNNGWKKNKKDKPQNYRAFKSKTAFTWFGFLLIKCVFSSPCSCNCKGEDNETAKKQKYSLSHDSITQRQQSTDITVESCNISSRNKKKMEAPNVEQLLSCLK